MEKGFEINFDERYTDKNSVHSYLPIYYELINHVMKDKMLKCIRLMEIGIQRGGSIMGWLRSLPASKIIGVDCQKTCDIKHPNYEELICNAYEDEFMEKIPPASLDFIIDDGSHAFQDLIFATKNYPKLLKKGGILVLEDIPDETWVAKLGKVLPPGYKMTALDLRSAKGRWDDFLLVIEVV